MLGLGHVVRPDKGYRTFRLLQLCLVAGVGLGALGVYKGVDLLGLSGLITSIIGPVGGFGTWKAIGTAKADATVGVATANNGNGNGEK